jgi:hypothetical protein
MNPHRKLTQATSATIEGLEGRRLLSAEAPNFLVVANNDRGGSDTERSVNYYDLNAIDSGATDVFSTPTLTMFVGYENTSARNHDEFAGLTVNPINGDTYQLAFDSGTAGDFDAAANDTDGDYDLYRYNFGLAHGDFVANSRPQGVMYLPAVAPDGFDYAATYGVGTPAVDDSSTGIPAGRSNIDADPSNDFVILPGSTEKVAEIARVQTINDEFGNFFNEQDLQFVDADTLLFVENDNAAVNADATMDRQIRLIERVSQSSGAAAATAGPSGIAEDLVGGYNNGTTESWQSVTIADSFNEADSLFINLDGLEDDGTVGVSDVDGLAYVEQDGRTGVWVSEFDGGDDFGADFVFFDIDFDAAGGPVAERAQLGFQDVAGGGNVGVTTRFDLDEDPGANDNAGDIEWFDVDEKGNLIIAESDFGDDATTLDNTDGDTPQDPTAQGNSDLIFLGVNGYNNPDSNADGRDEIVFDVNSFEVQSDPLDVDPADNDDPGFLDSRVGVYNRGLNAAIYIENDGSEGLEDFYVYDLDSGSIIYSELDADEIFTGFTQNQIATFALGDYFAQDGIVGTDDIDALFAATRENLSAVEQEGLDLTGDDVLFGVGGDATAADSDSRALIENVLGTFFGDANLDRQVNLADFGRLRGGFGSNGGFADGNFNGDDTVDLADFGLLRANFGNNNNPSPSAAPLPTDGDDGDTRAKRGGGDFTGRRR